MLNNAPKVQELRKVRATQQNFYKHVMQPAGKGQYQSESS